MPMLAAPDQADPMVGTWKLHLSKSKYDPGPKSTTLQMEGGHVGRARVDAPPDGCVSARWPGHWVFLAALLHRVAGINRLTFTVDSSDPGMERVTPKPLTLRYGR